MKKIIIALIILLQISNLKAQDNKYVPSSENLIIVHENYIVSYNELHEQADWVAYELKSSEISKKVKRSNQFKIDPLVKTNSAHSKDYAKTGFDRGHLAPAADMCFSQLAMKESFFMSNISPQKPSFNRGIWKQLESKTRYWAKLYGKVYVITGGVLKPHLKTIGENNVSVPEYFYKVLLYNNDGEINIIGFLFKNQKGEGDLKQYSFPIDAIEQFTGIDFFSQLEDSLENKLEAKNNINKWKFN